MQLAWSNERPFDFTGEFYSVQGASSDVRPLQKPHPLLFFGGASAGALAMGAKCCDVYAIYGEPLASIIELVDRVIARFALAVVYLARLGTLTNEVPNHLLEEAQYTVFCDVDGFDDTTWFDDRDARAVTLKEWNARDGRVLAGVPDRTRAVRAARIWESVRSLVSPRQLNRAPCV